MRKTQIMILASAATFTTNTGAGDLWPWATQNPKDPPKVQPYEIPTFGAKREFRSAAAAWQKAPRIDGDEVFRAVVLCYPEKSRWNLDVELQSALRTANAIDITGTTIGKASVGIVAKMPLYSAGELEREQLREYQRRTDTAKLTADLVGEVANRNRALRNLGLAAAMEARAQVRVNQGIADADEQVRYLDKVSTAEKELIDSEAKIMQARLALVAMCRDSEADRINRYLTELVQAPAEAKP